jgi:hypothetical protein
LHETLSRIYRQLGDERLAELHQARYEQIQGQP